MKLPTSIENILNENIVENARLELKKTGTQNQYYIQFVLLQIKLAVRTK